MKITNRALIADLKQRTNSNIKLAEALLKCSDDELNSKSSPEKWSALECVEHLNRYGDFYIPEINKRLVNARKATAEATFKSGWLGNKFAQMMLPEGKKMQTFKNMNPAESDRNRADLDKFLQQQNEIMTILENCENINLSKTKTSITISSFIKLKLGDTLRVVIYHNQRHMLQAQRATIC